MSLLPIYEEITTENGDMNMNNDRHYDATPFKGLKKAGFILLVILLNAGAVYLALRLRFGATENILNVTGVSGEAEFFFSVPLLVTGAILFGLKPKWRPYLAGAISICISAVIFLFFFLNQSLSSRGDYQDFGVTDAWQEEEYTIGILFKHDQYSTIIPVTQDRCFKVDSIQVRIDKGFFGFPVLTQDVQIRQNTHCDSYTIDSTDALKSYTDAGHLLFHKRCFTGAAFCYSKCIELDSLSATPYYQRGLTYMIDHKYELALADFIVAAQLEYAKVETYPGTLQLPEHLLDTIKEKVRLEDYAGLVAITEPLSMAYTLERYMERIAFCLERMKEEKDNSFNSL